MVYSNIFDPLHRRRHCLRHYGYCEKIKGRLNFFGGLIGSRNGNSVK